MIDNKKKRTSMLRQIAVLFAVGVILIGTLTSLVHLYFSHRDVTKQLTERSEKTSMEGVAQLLYRGTAERD